jgi:hypothetical protein
MEYNFDTPKSTQKPQPSVTIHHSDQEMLQLLNAKYPNQGFTGNLESIKTVEKQLLTFATVYDLSKQGKFEEIRPDILVPNFRDILEIYNF